MDPSAPVKPERQEARRPAVRKVIETIPGRGGCSELRLECGHAVRRRIAFCSPTRVICPYCKAG